MVKEHFFSRNNNNDSSMSSIEQARQNRDNNDNDIGAKLNEKTVLILFLIHRM